MLSTLPGSPPKYTPASTCLSSVSMPIFCQPSLTSACSFWRLERRLLALDLLVRVGQVHQDLLDARAGRGDDRALAALFDVLQDRPLDLQVPGVVVLAGLQDRPRGRGRVAAALELDAVER